MGRHVHQWKRYRLLSPRRGNCHNKRALISGLVPAEETNAPEERNQASTFRDAKAKSPHIGWQRKWIPRQCSNTTLPHVRCTCPICWKA